MTSTRPLNSSSKIGSGRFLQTGAGSATCLTSNRPAGPFVQSRTIMRKFIINLPSVMALTAGVAVVDGNATWQGARAQTIVQIQARVIATNVPGASAISQVEIGRAHV